MKRRAIDGKKRFNDVAKLAEVSIATIYRVASGNAYVSPEIQERVRAAAEQLGVILDRKNKPNVLAFLLGNRDRLHAVHSHVLAGAEAACRARGWDLLFQVFRYDAAVPWKDLHLPRILQRRDMVRAVVLAGTNSLNLLDLLQHRQIPFVVLGHNVWTEEKPLPCDAVFADDIRGACEMTNYLQNLHHRDIWVVGNTTEPWSRRFIQGYGQAMKEAGLPVRESAVESDDATEAAYLGTKSLLARGEPVTAILGTTDQAAEGIYKALKERGLSIPEDISVGGCNDTSGSLLSPPLTTIRPFHEQLGRRMVELLLNRIDHPDLPPQQVVIPTELVKRESCRAARPFAADESVQDLASVATSSLANG